MIEFKHYPVMLNEILEGLECQSSKLYVDGTLGGGGYSYEIAKRIQPDGTLLATDVDEHAIEAAKKKLDGLNNVKIFKQNYSRVPQILRSLNIDKITGGYVLDLGASSFQFACAERGFSFSKEAKLDMRFDLTIDKTAYDVVNQYCEKDLVEIFSKYGEERFSKTIARAIVKERKSNSIETTNELADLICDCIPFKSGKIHPATKVFQALRIEVNDELENLRRTLEEIIPLLAKDAKIVIVSFHSLEDRIVKQVFKKFSSKCLCKPTDPICKCEPPKLELISRKPILPSDEEIKENPPSRSAKLRVAKRI